MKLLIELPTWMGDTIMATPAMENLLRYYNYPKITLIGSSTSTELMKNCPNVDQVKVLNKKSINLYKNVKDLGKFDVFVSFRGSFRARLIKLYVNAKSKYQFDKKTYIHGHVVEQYNNFINDSLGINQLPGRLMLKIEKRNTNTKNKKLLGINPGASYGSAKQWYPEQFADVATNLSNEYDIVIYGGPDEVNIAADIEVFLIENGVRNFITGDSGPMHIAAALQVPTVAIFGPTNDKETSQWMNEKSIIVKENLACQPCLKRKCPLVHHNCMKLIKAKDVLEKIKNMN